MDKLEKHKDKLIETPRSNRKLAYLDLAIPPVDKNIICYKDIEVFCTCNFRKRGKQYTHILHNIEDNTFAHQLNTLVDLQINLSENLYKTDKRILESIKDNRPIVSPSQDKTISLYQTIINNQEFIKTQLESLIQRTGKTLYKADKFPSKKDIQKLLQLPKYIEEETKILIQNLSEKHNQDIRRIESHLDKLYTTLVGPLVE